MAIKISGTTVVDDSRNITNIVSAKPTRYTETVSDKGSATGTVTLDCSAGSVFTHTSAGTTTYAFSNPPASGTAFTLTLILTSGGAHTINWPASVTWTGGADAPTHPDSGDVAYYKFVTSDGGTNWYAQALSAGGGGASRGEVTWAIPGSYTWNCPEGVTSVSAVVIGGGGGAGPQNSSYTTGGGGGALSYKNNYSVTPGSNYSVVVGGGGYRGFQYYAPPITRVAGTDGGQSYFVGTGTLKASGGDGGNYGAFNGSFHTTATSTTGDGGGQGGRAGNVGGTSPYGAGGGAGGYDGNGGNAKAYSGYGGTEEAAAVATGGGGGAGGGAPNYWRGGGGGVGIFGEGPSGANGGYQQGGGGGSGGSDGDGWLTFSGNGGRGGLFGGGGGNAGIVQYSAYASGSGGGGAVRIVWPGDTRQFPATDVGES